MIKLISIWGLLLVITFSTLTTYYPQQGFIQTPATMPASFARLQSITNNNYIQNPFMIAATAIPSTIAGTPITTASFSIPINTGAQIPALNSTTTFNQSAISRLGITTSPFQINFDFPTHKFAQAGAVFANVSLAQTNPSNFSNSTFNGFSNAYKSEMAYLIASIKNLDTVEGRMLSDKLTMDLISIDNTLKLISMNKSRQTELKPLLQFQVKQFMTDLDMVQDHLSKQTSSVVVGDSNMLMGKGGIIQGNGNTMIGHGSMITGDNNALIGNQSIISGINNGMVGNKGVTIGTNNSVNASGSYVFTNNELVTQNNMLVVGNHSVNLTKLEAGQGGFYTNNGRL